MQRPQQQPVSGRCLRATSKSRWFDPLHATSQRVRRLNGGEQAGVERSTFGARLPRECALVVLRASRFDGTRHRLTAKRHHYPPNHTCFISRPPKPEAASIQQTTQTYICRIRFAPASVCW
jgi:hypothetical protein